MSVAGQELAQQIRQMVAASLIVEESSDQLAFRHALTREAVYSTLLRSERRHFHQVVAEAMRQAALERGGTLDAFLADLAYHYYEAEAWEQALDLAERAGARALAGLAAREAAGHFTRALDAAEHLGIPNRSHLLHARGQALEALGEFEPARTDYEAARECACEVHDGPGEWQALIDLGFLWAGRDYQQTGGFFRLALERARALRDSKIEAHSLNRLGNWLANTGEPAEAIALHSEALAAFRAARDRAGEAETLDLLCFAHGMQGNVVQCHACGAAAVALYRTLENPPALFSATAMLRGFTGPGFTETTYALPDTLAACEREAAEIIRMARALGSPTAQAFAGIVLCHQFTGYGAFGRALALGAEALRLAQSAAHQQWIAGMHCELGMTYFWMLESEASIDALQTSLGLAHKLGSAWWIGLSAGYLALAWVQAGNQPRAREVLSAEFAVSRPPRTLPERRMLWAWGELALAGGEPERALAIAEQLLASVAGAEDAPLQAIPCLWKLKGEAHSELGRVAEAGQALERAKTGALERGARPLLWQVHRSLARLHQTQGRPEAAAAETAAAQTVIASLAAAIDDEPQRARFMRAAEARLQLPAQRR